MSQERDALHPAARAGALAGQAAAATDAFCRQRRRGLALEVLAATAALGWCSRNPGRAGPEGGGRFVAAFRTAYAAWSGWTPDRA